MSEETVVGLPPHTKVIMESDPVKVLDRPITDNDVTLKYLALPNVDSVELETLSEIYPKLDITKGSVGKVWFNAFMQSMDHLIETASLSKSVQREDSSWVQRVEFEGVKLGPGQPVFKAAEGETVSGEKALMLFTNELKLGANIQVPLWHTGIWVSIKAPSEASLLELDRRISEEKITLGRLSSGMIFSNSSIYTVMHVVDFTLKHVYDSSIKNINPENLKSTIKIQDIHTLIWGLMVAIEPNGYDYARACTTNPAVCQHIVEGTVDLKKIHWVDRESLTEWQKRLMSKRSDKVTTADLKRYAEEHIRGGTRRISIVDPDVEKEFYFDLHSPSIANFETSGHQWVDGIIRTMEESLGVNLQGRERDNYLLSQARVSTLNQYAHYIKSISLNNITVDDPDTIIELLATLSSKDYIVEQLFEGIGKYIDDSMIALVAIPKYVCPNCGGEQTSLLNNSNLNLLPIDPVTTFFTLLGQRITRALIRSPKTK